MELQFELFEKGVIEGIEGMFGGFDVWQQGYASKQWW
jgi:hypothetical protein